MKKRQHQLTHLGSCNRVSVGREFKGKCCIKRCKSRIVTDVFIDDGQPRLSRHWGSYCRKHISQAIKSGWVKNDIIWKSIGRRR